VAPKTRFLTLIRPINECVCVCVSACCYDLLLNIYYGFYANIDLYLQESRKTDKYAYVYIDPLLLIFGFRSDKIHI